MPTTQRQHPYPEIVDQRTWCSTPGCNHVAMSLDLEGNPSYCPACEDERTRRTVAFIKEAGLQLEPWQREIVVRYTARRDYEQRNTHPSRWPWSVETMTPAPPAGGRGFSESEIWERYAEFHPERVHATGDDVSSRYAVTDALGNDHPLIRRPVSERMEQDLVEVTTCPVCGGPVERDRIDVTTGSDVAPRYIPGPWQCPRGCDPRTVASIDPARSFVSVDPATPGSEMISSRHVGADGIEQVTTRRADSDWHWAHQEVGFSQVCRCERGYDHAADGAGIIDD